MLLQHLNQVREILVSEEYLAFAVLYVILEVEGYCLGGAEVFHRVGDDFAQIFCQAEKVVDRVFAVEYNGSVFGKVYAAFAEFCSGQTDHFKKLVESYFNSIFAD